MVTARNRKNNADRQPDLGEGSKMKDSVEQPLRMRTGRKWKRDGSVIVIGFGCESRLKAAYKHQKRTKRVTDVFSSKVHPYTTTKDIEHSVHIQTGISIKASQLSTKSLNTTACQVRQTSQRQATSVINMACWIIVKPYEEKSPFIVIF